MMRKNKFVNPVKKVSETLDTSPSPNGKEKNNPLMQNKIYFPASYQDKLKPYKLQSSYQKNQSNFANFNSKELYDVKEKKAKGRNSSFGRENKFEKVQEFGKEELEKGNLKKLVKYNTIELKNLPGISYTMSGSTIYRSKNIKSVGKLLIDRVQSKRGKAQFRRNISLRKGESVQSVIAKSKSNKHTNLKDKKFFLYQTYFSSKSGLKLRSNSCRPFLDGDYIDQARDKFQQNPQDILLAKVIQNELYQQADEFQQYTF